MDNLQFYNQRFPCSKRKGYGYEGCKCTCTRETVNFFECDMYGNVQKDRCTDCIYQYKEINKMVVPVATP